MNLLLAEFVVSVYGIPVDLASIIQVPILQKVTNISLKVFVSRYTYLKLSPQALGYSRYTFMLG
jgi:hypothetical protein